MCEVDCCRSAATIMVIDSEWFRSYFCMNHFEGLKTGEIQITFGEKYKKANQCIGKRKYDTPFDAAKMAAKLSLRSKTPMDAYLCPHCGFWHYGHSCIKNPSNAPEPRKQIYK